MVAKKARVGKYVFLILIIRNHGTAAVHTLHHIRSIPNMVFPCLYTVCRIRVSRILQGSCWRGFLSLLAKPSSAASGNGLLVQASDKQTILLCFLILYRTPQQKLVRIFQNGLYSLIHICVPAMIHDEIAVTWLAVMFQPCQFTDAFLLFDTLGKSCNTGIEQLDPA